MGSLSSACSLQALHLHQERCALTQADFKPTPQATYEAAHAQCPPSEDQAFDTLQNASNELKNLFYKLMPSLRYQRRDFLEFYHQFQEVKHQHPETDVKNVEEKFEAYQEAFKDYQEFSSFETTESTKEKLCAIDPKLIGEGRYDEKDFCIIKIAKVVFYAVNQWFSEDRYISRLQRRLPVLIEVDLRQKKGVNAQKVLASRSKFTDQKLVALSEKIVEYQKKYPVFFGLQYSPTKQAIRDGIKAGHQSLKNKGSYGSLIYKGSNGRRLGVFKSVDTSFSPGKRIKQFFAYFLKIRDQEGYLPLPKARNRASMIAERACFLLDEVIGAGASPQTEIIEANGSKGSFQHFLHGYREAMEVTLPTDPNESDICKFQRFAILDFLQGNLDRKLDNWMVKLTRNKKHFADIKMIDNANSFPRGHLPQNSSLLGIPISSGSGIDFAHKKQYQWKDLPIAQKALTEESRQLINSLTDQKIQQVIQSWKDDLGEEDFNAFFGGVDEDAIKAFKDRVKVLRKFATENQPFSQLGTYGTYPRVQGYLGSEMEGNLAEYTFA